MVENMLRGNRLFHTLGFQIAKRKKPFSTTLLCDKTFHNVNSYCPWKIFVETFTQMAITGGKKWGKKEKVFIWYTYDECCATHLEQKLSFSLTCSWNAPLGIKWISKYKNTWRRICANFSYFLTRSLAALGAPTSSWRPFEPLDFILRALRALRPVRRARLMSGSPFFYHFTILDQF